jgi:hypothetical protein
MSETHGMSYSREYKTWMSMWTRCSNPKATGYESYGGRGIRVCKRWMTFEQFYADMGPRPEGTSLDRINTDGNYSPRNCRWATPADQARNRRNNHLFTAWGESHIIPDWSSITGINSRTLWTRIRRGWPPEVAFNEPVNKVKSTKRKVSRHL